jgi:hypothetical protein
MPDTIQIDGTLYTADELAALIGAPIDYPLSDDELLAVEQAIYDAENRRGPLDYLLDATVLATLALLFLPRSSPGVKYVESRQQYYRGRVPLSETDIERRVRAEQRNISRRTHQLGKDLARGRITLRQYHERMAREVYDGTLRMMAAGNGGQWSDAQYRALQRQLWGTETGQGSLRRLRRHIGRIRDGELTEAQLLARSRMYGVQTFAAFYLAQHIARAESQQWVARRYLDAQAFHCPDCPAYVQTEWVPASEVVPVGAQCKCGGNCRCTVIYARRDLSDRTTIEGISSQQRRSGVLEDASGRIVGRI